MAEAQNYYIARDQLMQSILCLLVFDLYSTVCIVLNTLSLLQLLINAKSR